MLHGRAEPPTACMFIDRFQTTVNVQLNDIYPPENLKVISLFVKLIVYFVSMSLC